LERLRQELRHSSPARQDELLAALVRAARNHHEAIAAVAACLLPGLRSHIRRFAPGLPPDDAWSVAVEGLCAAIVTGDVPRTFVAARLLDGPKRYLQRDVRREVIRPDRPGPIPDRPGLHQADEPSGSLILGCAANAGAISRSDAALLHTTVFAGHGLAFAAGRMGVAYETAKKRRQRAGQRWADWWTPEQPEPNPTSTTGEVA
jgi:hypothetical protein